MFWLTVLVTACALLAVVAIAFVIGASTGKHSIMDVAWGTSIAVAGLVSFLVSAGHGVPGRRWPLAAAAVLWGARLALHIAVRARGKGEDPRYDELLGRAPGNRNWYALRMVYLPQLLILWVACLPLTAGMTAAARPARSPSSAASSGWSGSSSRSSATGSWRSSAVTRPARGS